MNASLAEAGAVHASPGIVQRWETLKRRRRPALGVGLAVILASIITALFWPATYQSTGTILIEQQELPSDLVQSTITSYADQRIQIISQRVMTTDNLLQIIQRFDLYPRLRKLEPREKLLERMREDVHFQMISAEVMDPRQGRATKANIAFAVSYDSRSPELAARVANELVTLYLNENVKSRRQQSANAATFLNDEADRLEKTVEAQQTVIAAFKDKHIHTLPDQSVINSQLVEREREELRDVDTQLRALDQQATFLDAQLAQISPSSQVYTTTGERVLSPADRLKFLRTEYARLSGIYTPEHPDVLRTKREIDALEKSVGAVDSSNDLARQLEEAQEQLVLARQRYAPDHPDVLKLERQVAALTEDIAELPNTAVPENIPTPDNPAYIEIKSQRQSTDAQRKSLQEKRTQLQTSIDETERWQAASPAVERDYTDLVRELENDQLKYREVRQKQMGAKLSENLEDEQKGERFTLIDPPLVPQIPSSPHRGLIIGLGMFLALVSGLGTAFTLDSSDGSVRNRRDLESLLHVAPLAIVPRIVTAGEKLTYLKRRRVALIGAAGVLVLALILTHFLYRPLDVLWDSAVRELAS
jgi:polysaccharide biosynthesis transport protein